MQTPFCRNEIETPFGRNKIETIASELLQVILKNNTEFDQHNLYKTVNREWYAFCTKYHRLLVDSKIYLVDKSKKVRWKTTFPSIKLVMEIHSYVKDIELVEGLGFYSDVYKLTIDSVNKVTDLSELSNLHTLVLMQCENIADVSMLGKLNTLKL
jgi:hypothetical protein